MIMFKITSWSAVANEAIGTPVTAHSHAAHQADSAFPLRADTLRIVSGSNAALAYFRPQIYPYCVHAMELYRKRGSNLEEDLQISNYSQNI